MDAVLRAVSVYLILLVLIRISGRRTLAEATAFDFVLLLVIGEATQQALLGDDFSLTTAVIVIITLLLMDVAFSLLKRRSTLVARWLDGLPMVLVAEGRPLSDRIRKARLDEGDILEAARRAHGLQRMDQIRYAVLEVDGGISIIPGAEEDGCSRSR